MAHVVHTVEVGSSIGIVEKLAASSHDVEGRRIGQTQARPESLPALRQKFSRVGVLGARLARQPQHVRRIG